LRRSAVAVRPHDTLRKAAAIMDSAGVGALAVVEGDRLIGIATDRDLVRRGMAKGLDANARVDGVMTAPVVTIDADADLHDAFRLMSRRGIRRLAVTRDDQFVGMITVDDLLIDLAEDLSSLSRPVVAEVVFGHHDSPTPITH
jgi:CBS domain-containing protein